MHRFLAAAAAAGCSTTHLFTVTTNDALVAVLNETLADNLDGAPDESAAAKRPVHRQAAVLGTCATGAVNVCGMKFSHEQRLHSYTSGHNTSKYTLSIALSRSAADIC